MTVWQINEISKLTSISIRMLRHYDKIGLLKPSFRAANGYRCYTANDLAKLQQIIALKYFGFSLKTIKDMLQQHQNIYAHLHAQQQLLKQQSEHVQLVNESLSEILCRLAPNETPNGVDILTLITRYHMNTELKNKLQQGWAGKQLSKEQFNTFLAIYEKFPEDFAERDKIIEKITRGEFGDPLGTDGEYVVTFMRNLALKMKPMFAEQIKLSSSMMDSIKAGNISELELTPEGCLWLSRAMVGYWMKRWDRLYDNILENLTEDPHGPKGKELAMTWNKIIDEFYSIGPRSMLIGLTLWQEMARQQHEYQTMKTMPSPQDLVKTYHIKLLFNPDAASWISTALTTHANS